MTDREAVEYFIGCLAEIRESSRQWGIVSVTVEGGKVKFVHIQKPPKYKLEDGKIIEDPFNRKAEEKCEI